MMESTFNKLTLEEIRNKKQKAMELNFEICTIELKKNNYGKFDLLVSKVKVMDKNGKYIKFAKINEELLEAIKRKGVITVKYK